MSEATISAALLSEFYRAQTKPLAQERRNALLVVVNSGTANTPRQAPSSRSSLLYLLRQEENINQAVSETQALGTRKSS